MVFLWWLLAAMLAVAPLQGQATSLRGSKSALLKQNAMADRQDMSRIKNKRQLKKFVGAGLLVPLPNNKYVRTDQRLSRDRRYARPWTVQFANNLGKAFWKQFGNPIQVNSAVRTVRTQKEERKHNGNAAPASGPTASSHLTGATLDIAYKGMTAAQQRWVERWMLEREKKGWIEATKEYRQRVYHVMVFKNYGVSPKPKKSTKKK